MVRKAQGNTLDAIATTAGASKMSKEQELKNLMVKAQYQISKWGKCSNIVGLELFDALKAKIEEHGL
jgi:hypothetical protein